MVSQSPISPFLEQRGVLVLDGGLATELEAQGHHLDTSLWSAHLLHTHPDAIRDVHRSYLDAGADCIITATYQASMPGFRNNGYSEKEGIHLMEKAVMLANEARDAYLQASRRSDRLGLQPLVAASIGPYGAYLATGAEYHGDYGISKRKLHDFHEPRWDLLTQTKVDLLACETIPNYQEAQVLLDLLHQTPETFAWMSFSCRDGEHISDGTPIKECAALFQGCEQVVAVGVNCTAPHYISSLIEQIRAGLPDKPIVVYPNSGEIYDAATHSWMGISDRVQCGRAAREWVSHGAQLIGGCCRMGPQQISEMKAALVPRR